MVRRADVEIETYIDGDGPALVVLPSYGRDGGKDYDDITARGPRPGGGCCGHSPAASPDRRAR